MVNKEIKFFRETQNPVARFRSAFSLLRILRYNSCRLHTFIYIYAKQYCSRPGVNYRKFLPSLLSEMHFAPLLGNLWELDNFSLSSRGVLKRGNAGSSARAKTRQGERSNRHEQGRNMKSKFRDAECRGCSQL